MTHQPLSTIPTVDRETALASLCGRLSPSSSYTAALALAAALVAPHIPSFADETVTCPACGRPDLFPVRFTDETAPPRDLFCQACEIQIEAPDHLALAVWITWYAAEVHAYVPYHTQPAPPAAPTL